VLVDHVRLEVEGRVEDDELARKAFGVTAWVMDRVKVLFLWAIEYMSAYIHIVIRNDETYQLIVVLETRHIQP
jgi:hypothetical protein